MEIRLEHDFGDNKRLSIFLRSIKLCILAAAGLLGAAGGYAGQPEFANTQSTLSKAAYALFSVALVAILASFIGLFLNRSRITPTHKFVSKMHRISESSGQRYGTNT